MTKKKMKRIDPGANENPMPPVHDDLGERLAENAIATATSGDEPAEYKDDDELDVDAAATIVDGAEDELVVPAHR